MRQLRVVAAPADPRFRILGPIEADGALRPVPRGRTLSLLALLLIHRGAVVQADRAVDELWEGTLPRHGRKAVHVVASRLRAALGEGVVRSHGSGYAVGLAPGQLDADRFEGLLRDGRAELAAGEPWQAAATLRRALELWRGPALADVAGALFAQPEIARLEDLRLACLSDRIDADLACGRHVEVIGELEALVQEHPLRERLRGAQMLALYRAGRQADALNAYRAAYEALVDGLGIEPSPELRALEAAILRHEVPTPRARVKPLATESRRLVTCVFAQLANLSGRVQRDAECLRGLLDRCHDDAAAICAEHGGIVVESRSDALLAVFGAPVAHEDAAQRALRAAEEIVARTRELRGRCGVATGEVVAGPQAGTTAVIGEPVGAAECLGRAAAAEEIRIDARTWRIVRHAARAGALCEGGFRLAGFDASAPAILRRLDRPLVGREPELDSLGDAFSRVAGRATAEVTAVVGEPGIGKSRLLAELERVVGDRATVLTARCPSEGRGMTHWPLRGIVEQAMGEGSIDELGASLGLPPAAVRQVAAAVGLGLGSAGEDTAWAFLRLIEALARDRPLVLVLDDAHLAEPALLELLGDLAERLPGVPVLFVWVARRDVLDERHPGWGERIGSVLELGPLSAAAGAALLDALDGGRLAPAERTRIAAAAGGNPLFLEQLIAYLGDGDSPAELPPALRALLASRLDRLAETERSALALGSVVGDAFQSRDVHALADGLSRAELEQACERLVVRDLLLRGDGGCLRFRHGLVREVAYASLAKAARARLHERRAAWLERLGADLPEADARIGLHLEAACRYEGEIAGGPPEPLASAAGRRLAAAARLARTRGDVPGEIDFLERAVLLLGSDRPEGVELLPPLVAALIEAGESTRAELLAREAVATSAALDLPGVGARAAIERERVRLNRHPDTFDVAAAIAAVEHASQTLRRRGDALGLARADYLMADLTWMTGDPVKSYDHAERMLAHARRAESGLDIATAVVFMTWCLVEGPWPVPDALARIDALEAEAKGLRAAELTLAGCRGMLTAMSRGYQEARDEIAAARAGLAELQLSGIALFMAMLAANTARVTGDPVAAERAVREARGLVTDPDDRWYLSFVQVDLALALLAQDGMAGAAEAVAAIDAQPAPCDVDWVIKRHTARALLAARTGERGLEDARAAVAAAEGTSLICCRANAHRAHAELLAATGDTSGAAEAARRALALYEAKANAVAALATRAQFAGVLT